MIIVLAEIEVKEGTRDQFLAEFHKIVEPVRAEDGCIEYGPAIDTPTDIGAQPDLRENVVTVVEKWESVQHLKAHLEAPHMMEYRPKVKDIVVGTQLRILEPA